MTASELEASLGETPANCSWHLRQLAEHAFVEETHDGHGRRRPWRLVKLGLSWGEGPGHQVPGDEESSASLVAVHALETSLLDRESLRYRRNQTADPSWGELGMVENIVLMTESEAQTFHADLLELTMRHRGRLTGAEPRPPGARPVHVLGLTSVSPR